MRKGFWLWIIFGFTLRGLNWCDKNYFFDGYQWYFDNKISVSVGLGASFGNASKTSEDIKSSSVYEDD